jgi:hypothetical protein
MATVKVNAVDRSAAYSPEEFQAISIRLTARDGEVGQGSAPIPDPAGTQTPYAGQSFQFKVGATMLLDGFVGPLMRERGASGTGTRVVDTYAIGDENAVLSGFRAYNWSRPAETTRARFLAFLAAYVPWVTDTTWVTTDVVGDMPAKTYVTETLFSELFAEIKDLTGNTAFIENHRGHLHPATVGMTGGLAFSDASYDFSSTCPIYNPKRSKDPIDLRNDILVTSPTASATATDATSISRYDAGGLKHQSLVQLATGTSAEVAAKAAALLADALNERIMYEFDTGPLTAAQLASIPVGCLVSITSSVMGLSASTQRIASLTVSYVHPDLFRVHVELGFPVRIRVDARALGTPYGGGVGACSFTDWHAPASFSSADYFGSMVASSGAYFHVGTPSSVTVTSSAWLNSPPGWGWYGTMDNGSPWGISSGVTPGGSAADVWVRWSIDFGTPVNICKVALDAAAGGRVGEMSVAYSDGGASWIDAVNAATFRAIVTSGLAYDVNVGAHRFWSFYVLSPLYAAGAYYGGMDAAGLLLWSAPTVPPPTGTLITNASATGLVNNSNTSFTTTNLFVDGTLRVFEDGTDQTNHLTSSDGSTGAFVLDYAPAYGSTITTNYTAA